MVSGDGDTRADLVTPFHKETVIRHTTSFEKYNETMLPGFSSAYPGPGTMLILSKIYLMHFIICILSKTLNTASPFIA